MTMRSLLFFMLVACSGGNASTSPTTGSADLDLGGLGKTHATPTPAPKPDQPVASPEPAKPAPPAKPGLAEGGLSFKEDVQLLFRIAACGGPDEGRIPDSMASDPIKRDKLKGVADRHCKFVLKQAGEFRKLYFEKHRGWFEEHVPKDTKTVVYSFGGGDLLSALVAFPDATEITTISLELSGDPRRLKTLAPDRLGNSLAALRVEIGGLLQVGSNTSVNLSAGQRNDLPGQVSSHLMGLATAGYEPIDMRYFAIEDSGALRYLEQADIDQADKKRMKSLKGDWASPTFSEAFSNVEITYKRAGESQVRVFRHIGWNLGDEYLKTHPALLKHLAAKGKTVQLVKGASYLLHRPTFAIYRQFLLDNLSWMLSDSTGIPPIFAEPAGMVQETFGSYSGALLEGSRGNRADQSFIDLWRKNPRQKLGFRFGYVDSAGAGHVVITKPKS